MLHCLDHLCLKCFVGPNKRNVAHSERIFSHAGKPCACRSITGAFDYRAVHLAAADQLSVWHKHCPCGALPCQSSADHSSCIAHRLRNNRALASVARAGRRPAASGWARQHLSSPWQSLHAPCRSPTTASFPYQVITPESVCSSSSDGGWAAPCILVPQEILLQRSTVWRLCMNSCTNCLPTQCDPLGTAASLGNIPQHQCL